MGDIKVGDSVHVGLRQKGGAGISGTVTKIDGDRVHIKGKHDGKEYRGSLDNTMKESYGEDDHIMQTLADKDINSKVVGSVVHVHKDNVSKTKQILKKLGHDHEVKAGLNENEERVVTKKLALEDVIEVVFEGEYHFMDKKTGQLFQAEGVTLDEYAFLDTLDSLSEEVHQLFSEDGLAEVTIDKRDFVVHFTNDQGKKTRRKETSFSPAGLARKYEMNGHTVHDITHNGKSVMDEVKHVNSRRMNEDTQEDLNELSTELLKRYRDAANSHAKEISAKAKASGKPLQSYTAAYAEKDSPEQSKYNKRKRSVDKVNYKIAVRADNERKAAIAKNSKPVSTGDYIQHQYGQGRYMGDSVEIDGVDSICEQVILEGGVYFHANPVIKDKGHLLAIQNILSSSGAAGRKSFSGTKLAQVTKKIHDTAGIGNDVWDHIHTSRDDKNESTFPFVKSFSEFVLESGQQLDELKAYTLASYISKASADASGRSLENGLKIGRNEYDKGAAEKNLKRIRGITTAAYKLARKTNESEEYDLTNYTVEELQDFLKTEEFEELHDVDKQALRDYIASAEDETSK